MKIELTWKSWGVLFTKQATPSGIDKWFTVGPVHFRWTKAG